MIHESIFTAIYDRYLESPLPAFVEGFYFGEVPQDVEGTYALFAQVDGRQDYDMSSRLEDKLMQISIFTGPTEAAEGPTECVRVAEIFMLWFDDCELEIAGGTLIRIDRESDNLVPDPDGGWMYQIDYRILAQED